MLNKALEALEDANADALQDVLKGTASEEDFEDSDDTGVLPAEQVKALKAELKEARGMTKLAKRDPSLGDWNTHQLTADYLGHLVWTPPLPTQRKIASILTSIDTAIEKTEALIAKYQ